MKKYIYISDGAVHSFGKHCTKKQMLPIINRKNILSNVKLFLDSISLNEFSDKGNKLISLISDCYLECNEDGSMKFYILTSRYTALFLSIELESMGVEIVNNSNFDLEIVKKYYRSTYKIKESV